MSLRSAVAGTATVGLLCGGLGNPAVVNAAQDLGEDHRSPATAATLVGLPSWDVVDNGTSAQAVWAVVVKLAVLLVTVVALTALVGRGSRRSAFLAGWASLVVAGALAGTVDFVYRDAVIGPLPNPFDTSYVDGLVTAANNGAAFGLWTGWLVGAAVAATVWVPARAASTARTALPAGVATGRVARSPGSGPVTPPLTPPAPWWAVDASPSSPVQYNPRSVFPSVPAADPTSTLATPLARSPRGPDLTRPDPAASEPPAAGGRARAEDDVVDLTQFDPTVVERG